MSSLRLKTKIFSVVCMFITTGFLPSLLFGVEAPRKSGKAEATKAEMGSSVSGTAHALSGDASQMDELPRVRIRLKLKPYAEINFRTVDGKIIHKNQEEKAIEHVLRARLESVNHFHVQNFHIESIPIRWHRESQQYSVQLNIYKKFGDDSELEEKIGSTRIDGILEQQSPKLFSLVANKEASFVSVTGEKQLTLVAGSSPRDERTKNALELKALSKLDAVKPE